jgi:small subunit ribosomal protein S16
MRLQRRGKTGYAAYRIVVAERGAPVKGRSVANVGWYNPHTNDFVVKKEIVADWLKKGVKPSATVHNLLVTHGVITAEKVTSWKPKKKEAPEGAPAAEAAAPAADAAATPTETTEAPEEKPQETK